MSAIENVGFGPKVTSCMASKQPWVACGEGFEMKVLSVDEARHSVEALVKIEKGKKTGSHLHMCETSSYVITGCLRNETTGAEFGPGDYCYQPYNDQHEETFLEETVIFETLRGNQDKLIEFYDDNGEVCAEFKVSDFAAMLPR